MRATRREFLKLGLAAGAASALTLQFGLRDPRVAWAFYQSPGNPIPGKRWPGIAKFAQPLRGAGPGGIPVALPDGTAGIAGATHYSLKIGEYTDQLHPALGPTTLWGYSPSAALGEGAYPTRHLGGIIVAQRGQPVQLTVSNTLPGKHVLPVDTTIMGAGGAQNRAAVHLHGGLVPWISDGGPFHWFDPQGGYGASVPLDASQYGVDNIYKILNPGLQPGQAEYYYPNDQSARLGWYHDHAVGITRLNAYAGIASAYIIRDAFEGALRNLGLPDFVENGGRELPLVIQDKIFVGPDIAVADPTWLAVTAAKSQAVGSLWYPHVYEKARWRFTGNLAMPDPSVIPEMFGDTMLVNGTVFPRATVEARRYRLRVLNACQARFLNLQLYVADASPDGITYGTAGVPLNAKGPDFLVLGTEGGFLPRPATVAANVPFNPATLGGSLLTGPAERWDLLVDFSGLAGKRVILYNDAPAPFPMGAKVNDYYAGNQNGVTTKPGYGPDTRILLRFDVVAATSADPPLAITTGTDLTPGLDPFLVPPGVAVQNGAVSLPPGVPVRQLTLNEAFDASGRLIQFLGTNARPDPALPGFGRAYDAAATETPTAGATEVWQIANLTGDTHPIHFHLVNVQVLARQPFDTKKYARTPTYIGPARGPSPSERGWKETVQMHPGEVTTVIMRFDLPQGLPFAVPASPRTGGHEYVWHCHILEHEEHDMMRPLVVT